MVPGYALQLGTLEHLVLVVVGCSGAYVFFFRSLHRLRSTVLLRGTSTLTFNYIIYLRGVFTDEAGAIMID